MNIYPRRDGQYKSHFPNCKSSDGKYYFYMFPRSLRISEFSISVIVAYWIYNPMHLLCHLSSTITFRAVLSFLSSYEYGNTESQLLTYHSPHRSYQVHSIKYKNIFKPFAEIENLGKVMLSSARFSYNNYITLCRNHQYFELRFCQFRGEFKRDYTRRKL